MIMPVRYSDDPTINAVASRLVNNMAPSPLDFRRTNHDKTIAVIHECLEREFGAFARSIKITLH
jgi:hypothetical protein